MGESRLHIAMYPWWAMGHQTPFLHLANKLAKKGHKTSFLVPTKTRAKLEHLNLHPDLITFVPIAVPHVEGLPPGAENTSDVNDQLHPLIMTAMDHTEPAVRQVLQTLKPHFVFYDFTHWLAAVAHDLGIKSVQYCIVSPLAISYTVSPARHLASHKLTEADFMVPNSSIKLHLYEARALTALRFTTFGGNVRFSDRVFAAYTESDILSFRACREIEQPGLPFLAALKPPFGTSSIEEALPENFEERVRGRGIVHGGWVQQQLILQHPAIGCFITHCGASSIIEALVNKCQLVLLPQVGDQIFNARMMANNLKVGVEVEKGEEDGRLTKESVSRAVRTVMDEGDAYGSEVRENHAKIREVLLDKKLESTYIDCFARELQNLLH